MIGLIGMLALLWYCDWWAWIVLAPMFAAGVWVTVFPPRNVIDHEPVGMFG